MRRSGSDHRPSLQRVALATAALATATAIALGAPVLQQWRSEQEEARLERTYGTGLIRCKQDDAELRLLTDVNQALGVHAPAAATFEVHVFPAAFRSPSVLHLEGSTLHRIEWAFPRPDSSSPSVAPRDAINVLASNTVGIPDALASRLQDQLRNDLRYALGRENTEVLVLDGIQYYVRGPDGACGKIVVDDGRSRASALARLFDSMNDLAATGDGVENVADSLAELTDWKPIAAHQR